MTEYLTLAEVLAIHEDQIERYGGCKGTRDLGVVEAALYRPQTGYYADVIEQAAALWESLAQGRAFADGEKRTAFAVMYTFLAINGVPLKASTDDIERVIAQLGSGGIVGFDALVPWLRERVRM